MTWRVPLVDLDYGEEEERAVLAVLRNRWLTMGEVTQRFEQAFAEHLGASYALGVSNATMGLHLACLASGIGPGDEVILPSLTFVATANAVLYTGAKLRFADILGPENLNISPDEIRKLVGPKTRAIIVVHYGGYPAQMQEILDIAAQYGLVVIEDAAHAPGASLNGKFLGVWGDAGVFSFFSNKNLSIGEGGMLVTNQEEIATMVRLLRSHGMTSLTWDRHAGHAYSYDVVDLGYNYRIDEIRSALGLVQLDKLKNNNQRRERITKQYWHRLAGTGIGLPFRESPGTPAYHLFPILLPQGLKRKEFMNHLRAEGIQTSIHYPPIHKFSYYKRTYPQTKLPVTENVASRVVSLPLYPTMDEESIELVISSVHNF